MGHHPIWGIIAFPVQRVWKNGPLAHPRERGVGALDQHGLNKRVVRPLESYRRLKTLRSGLATALRRLRKVSARVAAMLVGGDIRSMNCLAAGGGCNIAPCGAPSLSASHSR